MWSSNRWACVCVCWLAGWYLATWSTVAHFLFNVVCPPTVLFRCCALCSVHIACMCVCVLLFRELSLIVDASLLHHFISRIYFDEIVFGWAKIPLKLHLFTYLFLFYSSFFRSLSLSLPRLSFLFLRLFGDAYFNGFEIFRIWIFRNFHSNCLPFSLVKASNFIHDLIRSSFALGLAAIELEMCMWYARRE